MTYPHRPERPRRIFHRYSRWPLVPAEDLLKLRHALLSARTLRKLSGPDATAALLTLVDQELLLRGLTPPGGSRSYAGTGTE